jgi:hypothetical protein
MVVGGRVVVLICVEMEVERGRKMNNALVLAIKVQKRSF